MMTGPHQTDAGRPACMEKNRTTEWNVKFCLSVFFLHAGRRTGISLMFSFIDNEIEKYHVIQL